MNDVRMGQLVELPALADFQEVDNCGLDADRQPLLVQRGGNGNREGNRLNHRLRALDQNVVVRGSDGLTRRPDCLQQRLGGGPRLRGHHHVDGTLSTGMLVIHGHIKDPVDLLADVDIGVMDRPLGQLRPGAQSPGPEALVSLRIAAFSEKPILLVGDCVDSIQENEAPGDLSLGNIVPGTLQLRLHQDIRREYATLEHCVLHGEKAELVAVDVFFRFEHMALGDADGLAFRVRPGDGDIALGLLGLFSLFGEVHRLDVQPRAVGVGKEHIIQHGPQKLHKLNSHPEDNHEHGVEDSARVKIRDCKALVLQLLNRAVSQLVQVGRTASKILGSIMLLSPPR